MLSWTHSGTAFTASFLASLVEFVEALTIVLAVGTVRGWRSAFIGVFAGLLFLTALVTVFGPTLRLVPLTALQIILGTLLLLFGMRWLRKAILRSAGVIAMHDEARIYAKQTSQLLTGDTQANIEFDKPAAAASFKAVTVEGLEVVFIVIATGAGGRALFPAVAGATLAGLLVVILGAAIHRPLTMIPENTLKFAVGVLLSAFGVFWFGEGLRIEWPGGDLSIVALVVAFLLFSNVGVELSRRQAKSNEAL